MGRRDLRWNLLAKQNLVWLYSPKGRIDDAEVRVALEPDGVAVGQVLWPEEMDAANHLRLTVPFFTKEQLGAAALMGPMSLDVIVAFCRHLKEELAALSPGGVLCACCTGRLGARTNSLLLVGAFLMLECSMLAADVIRELFSPQLEVKASGLLFPRPWTPEPEWSSDSLSLADCFYGLEVAMEHGWWDYTKHDSGARRKQTFLYDAALVCTVCIQLTEADSGQMSLWVAADPVTTVLDPHSRPNPPEEPAVKVDDVKAEGLKLLPSPTSAKSVTSLRIKKTGTEEEDINPVDQWRQRSTMVRSGSPRIKQQKDIPRKRTAFTMRGEEERGPPLEQTNEAEIDEDEEDTGPVTVTKAQIKRMKQEAKEVLLRPISEGFGFRMLQKMGWKEGEALGATEERKGLATPLWIDPREGKCGLFSSESGEQRPSRQEAEAKAQSEAPCLFVPAGGGPGAFRRPRAPPRPPTVATVAPALLDLFARQGGGGGGGSLSAVAELLSEALVGEAGDRFLRLVDERLGPQVAPMIAKTRSARMTPWGTSRSDEMLQPLWQLTRHHVPGDGDGAEEGDEAGE